MSRKAWPFLLAALVALAVTAAGPDAASAGAGAALGRLTVTYLDMPEHGVAIVLQTPAGRTYLIDTGSKRKAYDAGRDTIAPFLKARSVKDIAGILISHPHGDHSGGTAWLLDNFPVKQLIDSGYEARGQSDQYRGLRRQAQQRGAQYVAVTAGGRLAWDEKLEVEVLSPPKEFLLLDSAPAKVSDHSMLNNNSVILRVQHGKNVFLFPGDAYGSEGSYLLRTHKPDRLRATVLCAPHHGFNATGGYAAVIKPRIVVVPCLARYEDSPIASPGDHAAKVFGPVGARIYVTAWHGSVEVTSDGQTVAVKTQRPGPGAAIARPEQPVQGHACQYTGRRTPPFFRRTGSCDTSRCLPALLPRGSAGRFWPAWPRPTSSCPRCSASTWCSSATCRCRSGARPLRAKR